MVFYAAFNSISVISRRQLTLFMISWVSPVLGWALKCLAQGHSHKKTKPIQWGSNPGPLDYKSNTLPLSHVGPFPKQALASTCLQYMSFENTVGKGEIAHNKQFLLFPQCFLPNWRTVCHLHQIWNCHLQTLSIWKGVKVGVWERLKASSRMSHNKLVV